MKKFTLLVLLLFVVFTFQMIESRAEGEYYPLPVGRNYLDLGNLAPESYDANFAYTVNPIRVIPDSNYTLVMDYDFLGQHSSFLDMMYIMVEEFSGIDEYHFSICDDRTNLRAYIEFSPVSDMILIHSIPMMPISYDAILYEGTYAEFDGYEPFINPSEVMSYFGVLPINYDALLTTQQIKDYLKANDPYGNPLSVTIESDAYSLSNKLPGTYSMIFMSTFNNITKRYYLDVRVFDAKAPVLSVSGRISMPLTEKVSAESLLSQITVHDNVDAMDSTDLVIIADTYTQATQVGLYGFTVKATDLSGNTASLYVEIELIDNSGPVITGPMSIYLYTKDSPLTNSMILGKYSIRDDVDGFNVISGIEFSAYNQTQLPGTYEMTISAKDTLDNISLFNLNIHVIENGGPIFLSDEIILSINTASEMTNLELVEWFTNHTKLIGLSVSHVRILFNEYTNMEKTAGSYYVYLSYEANGEPQNSRMRVDVENLSEKPDYLIYLAIGSPVILGFGAMMIIKHRKK